MTPNLEHNDPQDRQFGAQAAADQEEVDKLSAAGVTEQELPDDPKSAPRAAGKAEVPDS